MKFVAVFFDELYYIMGVDEYGRGVVTRMDAHELVFEILVHVNDNIFLIIGQHAERSDSAADESHLFHKVFLGSECQRTCILCLAEFLEVYLLVLQTCDELILSLFIVADEKVFCDLLRVRQVAFEHLVYRVDRFVFDYFVFDLAVVKQFYDIFLCKCHFLCPFLTSCL